ncbi:MAG TPA: hypothetical protein VFS56_01680 [Gemmatimonadaceae bacterium]|nr:hypothetical protein [Gemmatimonadaceae bacterium]
MTDTSARPEEEAISLVREIIRRSGHEIRNALNGVAVNVEVVRSRSGRDGASGGTVDAFAQRAADGAVMASELTNGALAIIDVVLAAAAAGSLRAKPRSGNASELEVMIYGDRVPIFVSDTRRLATEIGVSIEQKEQVVILRVLPEDKSHSQA